MYTTRGRLRTPHRRRIVVNRGELTMTDDHDIQLSVVGRLANGNLRV